VVGRPCFFIAHSLGGRKFGAQRFLDGWRKEPKVGFQKARWHGAAGVKQKGAPHFAKS
jgi:hypothetical protein